MQLLPNTTCPCLAAFLVLVLHTSAIRAETADSDRKLVQYEQMLFGRDSAHGASPTIDVDLSPKDKTSTSKSTSNPNELTSGNKQLKRLDEVKNTYNRLTLRNASTPHTVATPVSLSTKKATPPLVAPSNSKLTPASQSVVITPPSLVMSGLDRPKSKLPARKSLTEDRASLVTNSFVSKKLRKSSQNPSPTTPRTPLAEQEIPIDSRLASASPNRVSDQKGNRAAAMRRAFVAPAKPAETSTTSRQQDLPVPAAALKYEASLLKLAQVPTPTTDGFAHGGNHFVPETSLTDSMLMDTDVEAYQPPRLFSHESDSPSRLSSRWGCNQCGRDSCNCRQVQWSARVDALFLHRSRADGFDDALMREFGFAPETYLSDSISMDMHGGPRFSLVRDNLAGGVDLEGTYYFIDHWTGSAIASGAVSAIGPPPIGTVVGNNGVVNTRFESKLQNVEFNLFKDVSNWTQFMVGFRYLQLDEHASVIGSGDILPSFDQRVDTLNNLYGGQLGLRKSIWDRGGFVTVDGTVKGGVFRNKIERTTFGFGTSPLDRGRTSFVGEVDIDMNYEITQSWSMNFGYQVMWITRVAEALDQFFSPGEIFDEGNAILHGFRVGITKTW